ncbi:MAG: ATP-dependent helicase, partial [Synergistaceae bacterium]|nr:ATP-dependent helicase [Synergistaceae bacterium]
ALQGDMTQSERNAVLASFKSGSVPCLVATNVAARGLDIEGVSHVIQLGLPDDKETFIHRSGRTGRAGHEGINLILLSPPEIRRFKDMLKGTQIQTEWQNIPGIAEIRSAWRDSAEQDIFSAPLDADFGECVKWAEDLITRAEPKIIIAKLLAVLSTRNKGYSLDRELQREEEKRNRKPSRTPAKSKSSSSTKSSKPKGSFMRFRSNTNQDVGHVLNAMCRALKVERSEIGAIRLKDNHVIVELMPLAVSRLENSAKGLSKFGLYPDDEKKKR